MLGYQYNDRPEDTAKRIVNNHRKFDSFCWYDRPEDSNLWSIFYTHNRDSDLLTESNATQIEKILNPLLGDNLRIEDHNHWVCGWIKGYSIKVYHDQTLSQLTNEFLACFEIAKKLDNYPVLNEEDYSNRLLESFYQAINDAVNMSRFDPELLPENWEDSLSEYYSDSLAEDFWPEDIESAILELWPEMENLQSQFEDFWPATLFTLKQYCKVRPEYTQRAKVNFINHWIKVLKSIG